MSLLPHPLSEQVSTAVRISQYPPAPPGVRKVSFVFSSPHPVLYHLSEQVMDAVSVTPAPGHGCCQCHPCSRSWMLSVSPLHQVMDAVSVTPAPGHGCCQCHPCCTLCRNRALFRHCLGVLAWECCSVIAWVALLGSVVPSLLEWPCWGVFFRHRLHGLAEVLFRHCLGGLAGECCSVIAWVALLGSVVPSFLG